MNNIQTRFENSSHDTTSMRVLRVTIGSVFVIWTLLFGLLLYWEHLQSAEEYQHTVRLKAEMLYKSTQALRSWVGNHGGVYVLVDNNIQPNPLLAGVKERDVLTPSGRRLTLYNSPALLRQVMTEFEASSGSRVRLISQQPLNPANIPDAWERTGLAQLSPDSKKIEALTTIDNRAFFRLMSPMILQKPCLSCHEYRQKEVGEVIGAVSVSLDAEADLMIHQNDERVLLQSHAGMWMLGTLGLLFWGWRWQRLLRQLNQSALTDSLTGIYNRMELMRRLEAEQAIAQRHKTEFSIIMLDIDLFKNVNDTYGHQAGDDVLKAMTQIIQDNLRASDLLARYGGEEFIIVCPQTGEQGAMVIAERIRLAVMEKTLLTRRGEIQITLSAGIAVYPRDAEMIDALIAAADHAMYEAKQHGRNRVCVYTTDNSSLSI